MFRTQANPMDSVVAKATDENLTSENWEYILEVCDRVSASASGPSQAIASLIKRLAHRNANVQLYTLELANALFQNCGPPLHRELASRSFTDALLRLAADRNTHGQVKSKVLERMSEWSSAMQGTPELGIMSEAEKKLRTMLPGLQRPDKPGKQQISSEDRRKEDEELQLALAESLKEKGGTGESQGAMGGSVRDDSEPQPAQAQAGAAAASAGGAAGNQPGTTAATVSRVRALYDFTPSEPGELAFRKNDIIAVLESVYKDWWKGSLRGQTGIFPLNYVEKLQDPTKEEMERDAGMEAEVFGEIRNVEKLLALLSVGGVGEGRRGEREEEEIGELYQRTLSIRPKLIELIGKYSQKKDDFTQLNEKFIKARRDYEALLESSMSAPQHYNAPPPHQQFPIRQQQYPQQHPQQPHYGGGYPPQGPPSAGSSQGYTPQQPYAAQSTPHLGQDPSGFYSSPAPSEPPHQAGYGSPYPQSNGPPQSQANVSAPFHFIPGGMPPAPEPSSEIPRRRTPKPSAPPMHGPSDPYSGAPNGGFQGQIRPNSIHTLNSGNPQELATSGYESPVENRTSFPPSASQQQQPQQPSQPQQQNYTPYPPQAQHQHPSSTGYDGSDPQDGYQRTSSIYSQQVDPQPDAAAGYPQMPQGAPPPPPPGSGSGGGGMEPSSPQQQQQQPQYQSYQPYQPQPQGHGGYGGGGDPQDFYR